MVNLKKLNQISTENNNTVSYYETEEGKVYKVLVDENGELKKIACEEFPFEPAKQFKKEKINKVHDRIFKFIAENNIQAFLNVFGLKHIIFKQFLNVEILDQTLNQSYCDLVIEAEDGKIYIIEFQSSGPAKKDKIRFGDYQTTLHRKKKGQKVIVIMITINDDPDNDEPYGYDKEYRYRINKRSTTCFNTEKVIKELEFKAENDCFDDEAYVKLQLLYYMESNGDERKKLLKKGVEIKNKIKNLSTDRKVGLTLIYMALAVHNFEEEELERFKEELKMNMSIEEYAVMGINHHIEERNKHLKKELEEKDKEHKKELEEKDEEIQAKDKEHKKELEEKDEEIQAKDKEHKKEIQAKDEEINKIRKLFKDFSESGDKKAMNTLKSILL